MKELTIEIEIDENGLLEAETFGFKGEVCESELKDLLSTDFIVPDVAKKDEYYQEDIEMAEIQKQIKRGRK